MKKLLAALFLSLFAVSTSLPVIAADKKDEAKKEMKKGEGKKADGKKKKGEGKKEEGKGK